MADTTINVQYVVNYYIQGTTIPVSGSSQIINTGILGSSVTETSPSYTGFTLVDDSEAEQTIILGEGNNEIDFYYSADVTSTIPHILTNDDVVGALRIACVDDIVNLEMLLSAVDDGIKTETGRDWTNDNPIDPTAKLAAALLFVNLYVGTNVPSFYNYKIVQLHAKALEMGSNEC